MVPKQEDVCAIVSVQPPDCPVSDTEDLIRDISLPKNIDIHVYRMTVLQVT